MIFTPFPDSTYFPEMVLALPPPTSSPPATPGHTPAPKATQTPPGTPGSVGCWIPPIRPEAVGRSVGVGSTVQTIGCKACPDGQGAIWIAPSPCAAGHRTHSGRPSSIQPWHCIHLLDIIFGFLFANVRWTDKFYHDLPCPVIRSQVGDSGRVVSSTIPPLLHHYCGTGGTGVHRPDVISPLRLFTPPAQVPQCA